MHLFIVDVGVVAGRLAIYSLSVPIISTLASYVLGVLVLRLVHRVHNTLTVQKSTKKMQLKLNQGLT